MSTPDQPGSPPLTRRQLREIRNTGATPIIGPDGPIEPDAAAPAPATADVPVAPEPVSVVPAHLPRASEPADVSEAPVPDASIDLGVSPLTRRQARQQERIRTASVPVITPEDLASNASTAAPIDAVPLAVDFAVEPERSSFENLFAVVPEGTGESSIVVVDAQPDEAIVQSSADSDDDESVDDESVDDESVDDEESADQESLDQDESVDAVEPDEVDDAVDEGDRAVVSPVFGADLLAGEPVTAMLPPTFDQLLTHSTSGSTSTPNALILSQTSGSSPLVSPVAATGEVLITGTFNLPEGLGSFGHAPGTADGKDVDAVLVDGELPAHSSPTPIAASAAVSTVKTSGEIIKPPVPEKGNKLMISLAITAGALAAALLAVLAIALISGVL